jgi:hypothetical protein
MQNLHWPCAQVIREPGRAELQGLARWHGPRARELTNGLRLSTVVLSQDLIRAWFTVWG